MVFSSAAFLFFFLPVAVIIYYLLYINRRIVIGNIWLLLISLVFYAWGEPKYVLLMVLSICMNYLFGRLIEGKEKTKKGKRIVALSCIYNIGILFIFKYLSWILGLFGFQSLSEATALPLPIGISFYTFQALSYVIDVYRGKEQAQKSILNVGLYISFFPQLIAGPIVRYGSIAEQLQYREHSFEKFSEGVWRFIIGLSKKILLANQLAHLADYAFEQPSSSLSVMLAWGGALAYMLQIYFDFSGYSDMAIGLGKMFGFEFQENFNYPYISCSVTEYWRRWHISLGEWFRDYLYYPLSLGPAVKIRKKLGNKCSRKMAANISAAFVLLIVWLTTGLWHGANMTFVVWGLLQFIVIYIERFKKPFKIKTIDLAVGFILTFIFVLCTKVIFRSESMSQAIQFYSSMIGTAGNSFIDNYTVYWLGQYKVVLIAGLFFAFPTVKWIQNGMKKLNLKMIWNVVQGSILIIFLIVDCCYVIGGGYNPFIYFNF